ncbi:indole-3-glycerol phosphate synthase TrpC [Oscillatoria amoena NRMC-F 0135]|nr:indole-3-glycerol phosphate synthase TrpC [Oscillatoria laete-virens]MDL5045783.1 indole-3-glycerol phosphate synthase TrpC [Oscillatoria amoena NRMC-F 0135]MDL5055156.1 indole-3-glycerol phosphate synthase TrpC [Oscillatoria laete-virens NRMC-F 0139]
MNILDEIIDYKRAFVAEAKSRRPLAQLERQARLPRRKYNFKGALRRPGQIALIAEVKKASPSAGLIRPDFDPVKIAEDYFAAGAAALSVLTDEKYFQGKLEYLEHIHAAVPLPLLRKDFTVDEYQIYEAALSGAAAILLIVAALTPKQIADFSRLAKGLHLDVLVEIHTGEELQIALDSGADIIGINNRDLKAMKTDLAITERLAPRIPAGIVKVGESGIHSRADVERLRAAGIDAILVGESIMKSSDMGQKIKELIGGTEN